MIIPFGLTKEHNHTWFIDLDGTILTHNGYMTDREQLLPGVEELWAEIPPEDCIILTTGREEQYRQITLDFVNSKGLRYNHAIFGLPFGERIVINDVKPAGLITALAWSVERNKGFV